MRISFVYSTEQLETSLARGNEGGRRWLVVHCPWGQAPVETLLSVVERLYPEEKAEMLAALGLPRADGA